jgi:hypothetical protein
MSPRVELARRVLETLAEGHRVSTRDAFQLRYWALRPEDSMLTLVEIATSILAYDESSASDLLKSKSMKSERPTCPERQHLSKVATDSIRAVFTAKTDFDAATKAKQDSTHSSHILVTARKAENQAVEALHRHRNVHGC